jgi:hypothetical protein
MKPTRKDKTVRALDVPRLVIQLPDGKEVHHHLAGREITIGRDATNRICIPDHFVSKFHAKLLMTDTSMTLVDLDSANKTYVNNRPIQESPVRFGDQLRFAGVSCRLEAPVSEARKPERAAPVAAPPSPAPSTAAKAPAPAPPAPSAPKPPARPVSAAKPRAPAGAGAARSTPPKVEADPMRRLLVIGGLLIAISLALAIFLRILLVPSESPEEASEETTAGGSAPAATSVDQGTPQASAPTAAPPASTTAAPVRGTEDRDAEFYFDEGLAHLDTGRLKEAQRSFERALELDPDHSRARTRLSLLNEEIDKQAETHFENASEAFRFLRYDEAIAEWEMYLMLAKEDDPRYAEATQGIEQAKAKLR